MPSPFLASHRSAGAVLRPVDGGEYPIRFSHPFEEHAAVRKAAGLLDLSFLGKLELSGKDAREFLHRIASADLAALAPGSGTWTYFLSGQGKILHSFQALATPEGYLALTEIEAAPKLAADLEKYRFGEVVSLQDMTDAAGALLVAGPEADAIVSAAGGGGELPPAGVHRHAPLRVGGRGVIAVRDRRTGTDGILLLVPAAAADAVLAAVDASGRARGMRRVGLAAYDSLRIEAGVPRFGLDVTSDLFPQEVGDADAFSLTKGCYPGQETVARIDTYGKVHRRLAGLVLDSPNEDLPERGDALLAAGEPVGEVRSWAISPTLERPVALAVLRGAKAPTGAELEIRAGERRLTAKVVDLPIVAP